VSRALAALLLAACVVATGAAVVCLLAPGRKLPAALGVGLCVALGAATISTLLFLLSLAGLVPSTAAVLGILVVAASVLAAAGRGSRRPRIARPTAPLRWYEGALVALLALPSAWVVADALLVPLHNIDAIAIWGLKGKVLALESVRASGYFHDPTLSYSHQDYPLLVPFLTATVYALRGGVDESLAKLAQAGLFGALLLVLYGGFRRHLSRASALVLLLLFLASPSLLAQAAGGLADPALMLFHAASLVALLAWLDTDDDAWLALGALLTAFLVFTKNEGMALAAIQLAVFSLAALREGGGRLRALWGHAALALALLLPWLWFRAGLPKTHENYGALLRPARIAEHLDRLPGILAALGGTMADVALWGGLWLLLPIACLLAAGRGRSREAGVLWACLVLHLAVYVVIFVVTPWDVGVLLDAKAYPLLLQASPALLLLLSVYWGRLLPPPGVRTE
jgi:hypothetical protein